MGFRGLLLLGVCCTVLGRATVLGCVAVVVAKGIVGVVFVPVVVVAVMVVVVVAVAVVSDVKPCGRVLTWFGRPCIALLAETLHISALPVMAKGGLQEQSRKVFDLSRQSTFCKLLQNSS